MTQTTAIDLELVPTQDMVAELKKRFDTLLIVGYRREPTHLGRFDATIWSHPDMMATCSLARLTALVLQEKMDDFAKGFNQESPPCQG